MTNVTGTKYSYEEVQEVIVKALKEELSVDEIALDSTLENLDVDSLLFAEILIVLQDEFDQELEVEDYINPKESKPTVNDLVKAVHTRLYV
ncbi:acyl carrier protein [Bacillus sp. Xin]|uniref:acyl carrier protein n=1 Tax=unclassified Bacillus (in: firmicutes) TaxID=185979 RepID=UPI001572EAEC|nr:MULTISPECIES: acyl carrier protein [unclassified Bacillus (in: firmicutes)]MBC6975070.1 acyl carrier protein [Bacillus sp. Xin]NSW39466.1 acyl carrier protein [Bacillus sp. Xin1]